MSTNRALQPPLPAALRPYEDVMKLLAAFSGPNCEVVLHDLSDPVHSVVRVENGEVTGRAVGQGLRHLVPNLLRMSRTDDGALSSESPNLLPVYWLRSRGRLIRALSLLIRDDAGEVIGVLCINQDVTNVSAAAGQLQALQSEYCDPLLKARELGLDAPVSIDVKPTIAEGIAIGKPLRGSELLEMMKKHDITVVAAPEDKILAARAKIARAGLYIEHTTAANFAAWDHYCELYGPSTDVLITLCGAGIKSDH